MKKKRVSASFQIIKNGTVCSPSGYLAAGVSAGLKKSGSPDMALIFSRFPAKASGAFTNCLFAAAPVVLCREKILKKQAVQAVIINSGNANACTGKRGLSDAKKMVGLTAKSLNISPCSVLVSSTGRIGVPMPMKLIEKGIAIAADSLSEKNGVTAAQAIMTTDTRRKNVAVSLEVFGKKILIGGMAKGAGMIAPDMKTPHATMLAYMTTDANVNMEFLNECVSEGVEKSFNKITIDGDTSTNDTFIALANGAAGNKEIYSGSAGSRTFKEAFIFVMQYLARRIVLDGEGVTKFVAVRVVNAPSQNDARLCAKAVANSLLCKTAWFGGDPNWGRIMAAAGRSGAKFNPGKTSLFYDDVPAVRNGADTGAPEKKLAEIVKNGNFTVKLDLNSGKESYEVWTGDISYKYVKINADYHT